MSERERDGERRRPPATTSKDADMERHVQPRVLNKRTHGIPQGALCIGRPGKWGNPFIIGRDGNRDEVVAKYRSFILGSPQLIAALHELAGKHLVCWCAPCACHGDLLLELANPSAHTAPKR